MTPIVVVAAIIERDGCFLVTLRPDGTHLAGHWEFPGGKVHESETHVEALRREVFEELDCVVEVGELAHSVTHAYPEKTVQLFFYRCGLKGEPKPIIGQQMQWVAKSELSRLPFPEADRDLIKLLCGVRL
jgi:8-oxo-dGTP diphosphatase